MIPTLVVAFLLTLYAAYLFLVWLEVGRGREAQADAGVMSVRPGIGRSAKRSAGYVATPTNRFQDGGGEHGDQHVLSSVQVLPAPSSRRVS